MKENLRRCPIQTTHHLKLDQVKPSRGLLFCEALTSRYETDSGIIVVNDLKKNPKIEKAKVISVGGPFTIHGRRGEDKCPICVRDSGLGCKRPETKGIYWAKPGDTIWMRRGFKKVDIQGKTYCFVPNEDITATLEG